MEMHEGDRQVIDRDIREHVRDIFATDEDEAKESVENLLQNDRQKTAEINLLVRENRMQRFALLALSQALSESSPGAIAVLIAIRQLREIVQKALDWKASDPE